MAKSPDKINKKKSAPHNSAQPLSPQNNVPQSGNFWKENWGVIANLLVTIIVGVFVAIYLQDKQQKFQSNLTQQQQSFEATQQALSIQSQQPQIKVDSSIAPSTGIFLVSNVGVAPANDVKVIVCLEAVNPILEGILTDIEQLNIHVNDKTTSPTLTFASIENYGIVSGNNCEIITLGTLSSQINIPIVVDSLHQTDITQTTYVNQNREVNIAIPSSIVSQLGDTFSTEDISERAFLNYIDRLKEYSDYQYSIAISCSGADANCVVDNPKPYIAHPYPVNRALIKTSTSENAKYLIINSTYNFTYIAPVDRKLAEFPLFLEVILSNNTGSEVITTTVPSFDNLK